MKNAFRSGFVAVAGPPNARNSALVSYLVGQKIAFNPGSTPQ